MQTHVEDLQNKLISVVVKEKVGVQLSVDILRDAEQESLCELFNRKLASLPRIQADKSPSIDSSNSRPSSPRKNTNMSSRFARDDNQNSPQSSSSRESLSSSGRGDHQDRRFQGRQAGGNEKRKINLEPEVFPESGKARGTVTYFKHFDEMYVRLKNSEKAYTEMMETINRVYSRMNKPMSKVFPGMVVGALDLEAGDRVFYRADVKSVEGDKAEVSYVDFGNRGIVSFSDIRPGLDEFSSCPAQAIRCCIKDVVNCPEKLLNEFKMHMENHQFNIQKHDPDNLFVSIFTKEGKDVTDILKEQISKVCVKCIVYELFWFHKIYGLIK